MQCTAGRESNHRIHIVFAEKNSNTRKTKRPCVGHLSAVAKSGAVRGGGLGAVLAAQAGPELPWEVRAATRGRGRGSELLGRAQAGRQQEQQTE